jgi:hypothetical protein
MKLKENRIKHQAEEDKDGNPTTTCGWHAMKFAMDILMRGKSFAEATGYDDRIKDKSGKYEKEIEEIKHGQKGLGFPYINMMEGEGVVDKLKEYWQRIKQFITGREPSAPEVMRFIQSHGGEEIQQVTVCRQPLTSMINKLLNFITLGKFNEAKRLTGYDKLYHLLLVFKTASGSYITERNEVIRVYKGGVSGESMPVLLNGKKITVAEFFEKPIKREGSSIFVYDAVNNNCQKYVASVLSANGLLTPALRTFINQNIKELFKKLPGYTGALAKAITDFWARVKTLVGQGSEE